MPQSDGVPTSRNQLSDQRPDKPFRHPINKHIWLLRGRLVSIFLALDRLPCQFQFQLIAAKSNALQSAARQKPLT